MVVKCPRCGYPQYCGCPACITDVPKGYLPEVVDESGECISCANCGFTMHVDGWLEWEMNGKLITMVGEDVNE